MSKAEEFIQENTKDCSNQYDFPEYFENGIKRLKEYQPWLTPDQARKAVEIARVEIYEWLNKNAHLYIEPIETIFGRIKVFNTDKLIKDLKQAMKDE